MSQVAPVEAPRTTDIRSKRRAIITLWLGLLAYAVLYVALTQLWLPSFFGGLTFGPYWLMIAYSSGTIPLTMIEVVGVPLFVLVLPIRWIPEDRRELFRQSKGALIAVLILAGLVTLVSGWQLVLQEFRHSETANIEGRIYQTAVYHDLFADQRPTVFQCDQFGLWCRRIYFLPETDTPSVAWTRLRAGEQPGTLNLKICWDYIRYAGSSLCETKQIPLAQGDPP